MAAISWIKRKKNNHTQTKTRIQNYTTGSWSKKTVYKSSENELSVYEQMDMASQIATVQSTVSLAWQAASSEERETDH